MELADSRTKSEPPMADQPPEATAEKWDVEIRWLFERFAETYENEASRATARHFGATFVSHVAEYRGTAAYHLKEEWSRWVLPSYAKYLETRLAPTHPKRISPATAATCYHLAHAAMRFAYEDLGLLGEPVFFIPWAHERNAVGPGSKAFDPQILEAVQAVVRHGVQESERLARPYEKQGVGRDPRGLAGPNGGWKDWDNMVWYFENVMDCTHHAALPEPLPDGLVCFVKAPYHGGVRKVYRKLGVLDAGGTHLYPLALALALETGLNPTSIVNLRVDCLNEEYSRLVGRPCLLYFKARSRGDKETPLDDFRKCEAEGFEDENLKRDGNADQEPLDDGRHFHWMQSRRAGRVKKLIEAVLSLTAQAREIAPPDLRDFLFLYRTSFSEDVPVVRFSLPSFNYWIQKIFRPAVADEMVRRMDPDIPESERAAKERELREEIAKTSFALKRYRATFATQLARDGAPIEVIQAVLGHVQIGTTLQYIERHSLQLRFYQEMSEHLETIKRNAAEPRVRPSPGDPSVARWDCGICECKDPLSPPSEIRQAVAWREGEACSNWSRCLFCTHCVITAHSLPKLIARRREIETTLSRSISVSARYAELLLRQASLIDNLLESGTFDEETVFRAGEASEAYSPEELDAFLVGGPGQWLETADPANGVGSACA